MTTHRRRPDSDTYTIVNEPNWAWEEVIEFYASEDATIRFHAPDDGSGLSVHQRIAGGIASLVIGGVRSLPFEKSTLLSLSVYLPNRLNQWVWNTLHDRNTAADIDKLRSAQYVQMGMFSYEPAPGPFLNELEETASRLDEQPSIEYLKID